MSSDLNVLLQTQRWMSAALRPYVTTEDTFHSMLQVEEKTSLFLLGPPCFYLSNWCVVRESTDFKHQLVNI